MTLQYKAASGKTMRIPCQSFAQCIGAAWDIYCDQLPFWLFVCLLAEESIEL